MKTQKTAFAVLTIICLFMLSCASFSPRKWDVHRPLMADEAEIEHWENMLQDADQRVQRLNANGALDDILGINVKPVDEKTRERIIEARDYLLNRPSCDNCLFWAQVVSAVYDIGRVVRITADPDMESAGYRFYTDTLAVNPESIQQFNTFMLASFLAHEMTHRVIEEKVSVQTKFTRDELLVVKYTCSDYLRRSDFAHEGIAYWNTSAWQFSRLSRAPEDKREQLLRKAEKDRKTCAFLSEADPGCKSYAWLWFLETMANDMRMRDDKSEERLAIYRSRFVKKSIRNNLNETRCGPAVAFREPKRGEYFDPVTALAPDPVILLAIEALEPM